MMIFDIDAVKQLDTYFAKTSFNNMKLKKTKCTFKLKKKKKCLEHTCIFSENTIKPDGNRVVKTIFE